MREAWKKTLVMLAGAKRLAVLTGAGVSAESGVPTFRGQSGLWRQYRPEELATPAAFQRDPRLVWEWYDWRRRLIAECRPNAGHQVVAGWESRFEMFSLATQNVDGLHQEAGSRRVLELHGSIWVLRCTCCPAETNSRQTPLEPLPPRCSCGGLQRPGVVWFGEALPQTVWEEARAAVVKAQVVLVIGTSALVQPAASLPALAKAAGAFLVEINLSPTPLTPTADAFLSGPSGEVLLKLEQELMGNESLAL